MQALNIHSDKNPRKNWIRAVVLVVAWIVIVSLVKDFWQIKKGFGRIDESRERLAEAENKNKELNDKLGLVSTEEYKERLIREQLNMQKIGEVVAVLPKKGDTKIVGSQQTGETKTQNWEKWWSLLK